VAPAPAAPRHDVALLHLPGNTPPVVAPAVSAPERVTSLPPKLTLPVPSVIAPAPQVSGEIAKSGPGFAPELSKQVVPPPEQLEDLASKQRTLSGLGSSPVVPPSAQLEASAGRHLAAFDSSPVVPPSAQLNASAGRRLAGLGNTPAVVAPAPVISEPKPGAGSGAGNRNFAMGNSAAPAALAPPVSPTTASRAGNGVVVSSQPGSKAAVPTGSAGALALSPSGSTKQGVGETGTGSGIGRGDAAGSAPAGADRGGAKTGQGLGWDTIARNGISPHPGAGGAGNGTTGKPPMPGVSVSGGGSKIITLPSFGADPNGPGIVGRSDANKHQEGPGITVVATSRSGGAFNFYGALKGDKVYTIYIDTTLGTAVMQFADPTSAAHPYAEDLTAPQPMRAELPANMRRSRLVIGCVLDRGGTLKNARVLQAGASEVTSQVMAALPSWKFRPALRGNQPVEVNAIVGFDIDTR
jgi:hypothetical protein